MGIDRIGKGAPSAPPKPASAAERAEDAGKPEKSGQVGATGKTFEVRPSPTSASPPPATASTAPVAPTTAASSPLEKLRAGEIDLDRYLDLKVNDATAHLGGLRAHESEELRALLRTQLTTDPSLVDLVRQATGQSPKAKG
jgi:hypothetical protein